MISRRCFLKVSGAGLLSLYGITRGVNAAHWEDPGGSLGGTEVEKAAWKILNSHLTTREELEKKLAHREYQQLPSPTDQPEECVKAIVGIFGVLRYRQPVTVHMDSDIDTGSSFAMGADIRERGQGKVIDRPRLAQYDGKDGRPNAAIFVRADLPNKLNFFNVLLQTHEPLPGSNGLDFVKELDDPQARIFIMGGYTNPEWPGLSEESRKMIENGVHLGIERTSGMEWDHLRIGPGSFVVDRWEE